jgi:hypothetical protein
MKSSPLLLSARMRSFSLLAAAALTLAATPLALADIINLTPAFCGGGPTGCSDVAFAEAINVNKIVVGEEGVANSGYSPGPVIWYNNYAIFLNVPYWANSAGAVDINDAGDVLEGAFGFFSWPVNLDGVQLAHITQPLHFSYGDGGYAAVWHATLDGWYDPDPRLHYANWEMLSTIGLQNWYQSPHTPPPDGSYIEDYGPGGYISLNDPYPLAGALLITPTVPEPASLTLLLTILGALGIAAWRRRRGHRESGRAPCAAEVVRPFQI